MKFLKTLFHYQYSRQSLHNLSLHIEYLLRYHDCVILPGFGAFLRRRIPARMDMETGELFPPRYELCFNSSINTDDGLLAHSVSRRDGISFEQARTSVSDLAEGIYNALSADGIFTLSHIGTLHMDSERNVSFEPYSAGGLDFIKSIRPVESPSVKKESAPEKQLDTNRYYTLRIPRNIMRYAAMIAVLILGCITLSMPPTARDMRVNKASVIPMPSATSPKSDKTASEATDTETQDQKEDPRYYLIVGASHSEKKCKQFMDQHSDFDLDMLHTSASRKLIYMASSSQKTDLLNLMRDEDVVEEFGQTWIYDSIE